MNVTPRAAKGTIKRNRDRKAGMTPGEGDFDFRTLADSLLSGIIIFQGEQIVYINQAAANIVGYTKDELLCRKFWEVMHPDFQDLVREHGFSKLRGEQTELRIEIKIVRKDGRERWVDAFSSRINYYDLPAVFVTAVDITELKRAEEERDRLYKYSRDLLCIIGFDGIFKLLSPSTEKILGWMEEEVVGKHFFDFIHPDDLELSIATMKEHETGREAEFENRVRCKDGSYRWISWNAHPLVAEKMAIIVGRDITEHKRAEEALRRSEANLERAQRIAELGNWEWDLKTNMLSGSKEYYRMFDVEQMVPMPFERFANLVHPDDRGWVDAAARDVGPNTSPSSTEFKILLPGNRIKHIQAHVEIVKDDRGRPVKVFGTMQDITERKRTEEELKDAKQQAELYLDLMGHDINNMHQIALGYLELARGMPPGVQQDEMIEKPIEVLQRSARLIKNVRKLQKLHDGAFQTKLIDVCNVLADVQREFGAVPGKTVMLNMNNRERCEVQANEFLHDVFANLVGNAIKHTGVPANIVVDLDVVEDKAGRYCRVMVEDDGPGIPDYFKGKIFNRLLKGTTKAKGMGIGLYLVKSLVDSYGGLVWAEDRVYGDHTKGARFVVMLPAIDNH